MNRFIFFLLLTIIIYRISSVVFFSKVGYFRPYYTEDVYKHLENLFNHSQYRIKNPTSIIADEIVFRYAAGAYLRGVDPILINSETTPLGKYFIAASIYFFQTDSIAIFLFAIFSLLSLWILADVVLGDTMLALVPVVLLSFEPLFVNQILVTPLMDIIQLPFILLSIVFFLREKRNTLFIGTCILLGFVMATKSVVPAMLLIVSFSIYLFIQRDLRSIFHLIIFFPISLFVFGAAYIRTFLNGYSIIDFFRFQKWIFDYQQSKLIYPMTFWKLMFFNEWQTWWGEQKILKTVDWQITWPFLVMVPFIILIFVMRKTIRIQEPIIMLLTWIFVYEIFLSLGVVSTRFLLPLLPVLYILAVYLLRSCINIRYRIKL